MLANPVVIPAYASPEIWVLAFVAMAVEVNVVLWLLRRAGRFSTKLRAPLYGINLVTWFPFLVAMDRLPYRWSGGQMASAVAGLEAAVVLVEMVLIHSALRGRVFTRGLDVGPITWRRALFVSSVGNLASIAMSLAVPALVWLLIVMRK